VYDRIINDKVLTFGVSGRLYQSNVLLYDHQTESLWSQLKEEAVTGPLTGTHLTALPSQTTTWKAWREQYPHSLVLSTDTGFRRDYRSSPYKDYARSERVMFPVDHKDLRLPPKARVLGVSLAGHAKAYPLTVLRRRNAPLQDQIGNITVKIIYDADADSAWMVDIKSGKTLPAVVAYWFAWATFHPNAPVYGISSAP
jgi:hypothetical protein